jgi:predicted MPP superfamily phosphohydrolase
LLVPILVYNFILTGLDIVFLALVVRFRGVWMSGLSGAALALVALALALAIKGLTFAAFHLLAYGWFLHLSAWFLACACIHWRTHRRVAWTAVALGVVLVGLAVDSLCIEPYWLEVAHVRLTSDKLERPVKIAVIADFQTDRIGPYERHVLQQLMRQRPEMVLFAGDYLQAPPHDFQQLCRGFQDLLKQAGLSAPRGVYAVAGNTDVASWPQFFQGLPVTVITQSAHFANDDIVITGLSVRDTFNPILKLAAPDNRFHIVLGHAPDFALGDVQADLMIAGHTHGGQVQLPWIGPLITLSRVPRAWASGVTRLSGDRTLVVSRGVGMERRDAPRLRFLCRPQLVVIEVHPRPRPGTVQEAGAPS